VSENLPFFSDVVDEVCLLKAMHTDEFNHAPAQLFMHTGSPRLGRPSMGSWVTYGLGTENQDLPGFIVLASGGMPDAGKRAWGSGFLPTVYQGVQCRSEGDPVLYVLDPAGMDRDLKGDVIETINAVNAHHHARVGDPEINSRIAQYEMAFRMQISVPESWTFPKSPNTSTSSTARSPASRRLPTTACWPGGSWNRAYGSCSSSTGAGTPTAWAPATT
jgi:hypothetical protein